MADKATILARGILLLGAAVLLWQMGSADGRAAWFAGSAAMHIFAIGLTGNLLFIAFPFRRRNDLALYLALAVASADMLARSPPESALADAAGTALIMLPVWAGRLRARTQRERRRKWQEAPRYVRAAPQTDFLRLPLK